MPPAPPCLALLRELGGCPLLLCRGAPCCAPSPEQRSLAPFLARQTSGLGGLLGRGRCPVASWLASPASFVPRSPPGTPFSSFSFPCSSEVSGASRCPLKGSPASCSPTGPDAEGAAPPGTGGPPSSHSRAPLPRRLTGGKENLSGPPQQSPRLLSLLWRISFSCSWDVIRPHWTFFPWGPKMHPPPPTRSTTGGSFLGKEETCWDQVRGLGPSHPQRERTTARRWEVLPAAPPPLEYLSCPWKQRGPIRARGFLLCAAAPIHT